MAMTICGNDGRFVSDHLAVIGRDEYCNGPFPQNDFSAGRTAVFTHIKSPDLLNVQ